MKFFTAIVLMAVVALACAEEPAPATADKLEPVQAAEQIEQATIGRNKRGFVYGAYTAPVAAVAPAYTAAYTAPVAYASAYTYSAGLPYAYSAYSPYYSSYPAVYY